ncbi:MAG: GrpB family protein [Solirubrobacteraceae bacterium]
MVAAPDPSELAAYEESLTKMTIGPPERSSGAIELRDYDPSWPGLYESEAARVRAALGQRVVRLEHVGSTSVPELVAKPIIDVVLEVPDSSDEQAYVPDLEAAGYVLRIREPDWLEHRMFKGPDVNANLHVFSAGCQETDAMVRFRDRLRANTEDRELYARVKRELASRDWTYLQQYADAKTDVVTAIMARTSTMLGG